MKNRISRSALLVLVFVCLVTLILLGRGHSSGEAMAQSQQKYQKWEYCYVTSPFSYGSPDNPTLKVYISQGAEKLLADTDTTGVAVLNRLGAEGWELVGASDELTYPGGTPINPPTTTRFLLKRPR